jgi:hypothetical protein
MEWMYEWIGTQYFTNIILLVVGIYIAYLIEDVRVKLHLIDKTIYANLPNLEALLYIIYQNNEERLGVPREDRYPRRVFEARHQDKYGYQSNGELDADFRSRMQELEKKEKKEKKHKKNNKEK